GAPPGYVGYDEGGQLTEAIRRKPYSIILFDEIEKAHPQVFNILLQILDDGRLTDNQGRTVDFKNTIIIMTSNLGSEYLMRDPDNGGTLVMDLVKRTFKPEFLNRIDEIILFRPLSKDTQIKIVDKLLGEFRTRLESQNLHLSFTDDLRKAIIDNAFDPEYGARPIKRYIQHHVETFVARAIIGGEILPRIDYVLDFRNGELALFRA
ncbi:MAG TPA: AAA family ATPase, partial [Candidatus Izemoplasmatales bacterium]|nr:AAA family ATPase [Candidatus Izemoplasmatales bacterium]